jgi:GxxExxY protein
VYDGIDFGDAFQVGVIVEDIIICELKAVEKVIPVHHAQLLTYLKLTGKRLGFLINFHSPLLKEGLDRIVNSASRLPSLGSDAA